MTNGLVLARKKGEAVVVDLRAQGVGFVNVHVVSIDGGTVRLLFEAPRHIPVNRKEVFEAKEKERGAA